MGSMPYLCAQQANDVCRSYPRIIVTAIVLFLLVLSAQAHAASNSSEDHPLLARYQGAERFSNFLYDYIPFDLIVAPVDDENHSKSVLKVYGKGSFAAYELSAASSHYEVVESFKQKLQTPPLSLLFECEKSDKKDINTCGHDIRSFDDKFNVQRGFQHDCTTESEFYLASAKLPRNDGKHTYVFVCVLKDEVNQTIVDERDFNADKIQLNINYSSADALSTAVKPQTETDKEGAEDHPLLTRFPGSVAREYKIMDYARASFPVKTFAEVERNDAPKDYFIEIAGKATFIEYQAQEGISQYQVYENYINALSNEGATVLMSCHRKEECNSGTYYRSGIDSTSPEFNLGDQCTNWNVSLITAEILVANGEKANLFLCISSSTSLTISQTIVEQKTLTKNLVSLSVDQMHSEIKQKGKVAVYGIHFRSSSDELMKNSAPSLEKVSELLSKQPKLKLFVVGHTDGQGEEHYNQQLSRKRANAVINALVKKYGIEPQRLQARGVGELVPVATNRADEGRQLNRRVELVEF